MRRPDYFAKHSPPRAPRDLARQSCVHYRRAADGDLLKWTFGRNGKSQRLSLVLNLGSLS